MRRGRATAALQIFFGCAAAKILAKFGIRARTVRARGAAATVRAVHVSEVDIMILYYEKKSSNRCAIDELPNTSRHTAKWSFSIFCAYTYLMNGLCYRVESLIVERSH